MMPKVEQLSLGFPITALFACGVPTSTLLFSVLTWTGSGAFAQTWLSADAASVKDSLSFTAKVGVVRSDFTDREILAATYTDYRVPQGFYEDPASDNESVGYINSISVWRKGPPGLELCTDNRDEARRWQHVSDSNSSVHRILLHETETDKYFEFRTEDPSPRHYIVLMRIHKCRYTDRSGYTPAYYGFQDFAGWFQGVFNVRPITTQNVRELGEYTWLGVCPSNTYPQV